MEVARIKSEIGNDDLAFELGNEEGGENECVGVPDFGAVELSARPSCRGPLRGRPRSL